MSLLAAPLNDALAKGGQQSAALLREAASRDMTSRVGNTAVAKGGSALLAAPLNTAVAKGTTGSALLAAPFNNAVVKGGSALLTAPLNTAVAKGTTGNAQLQADFQQGSSGQEPSQQHHSGSPSQQSRAGQEAGCQPPQHGGSNLRRTAAANAAGAAAALAASQSPVMQQRQECVRQLTGPAGEDNVRHCDTMLALASGMHLAMSVKMLCDSSDVIACAPKPFSDTVLPQGHVAITLSETLSALAAFII